MSEEGRGPAAWGPAEVRAWVERHGGNRTELARVLGVSRTRLQDWISETPSQPPSRQAVAHMRTLDRLAELERDRSP